jgi:hypothetical protein
MFPVNEQLCTGMRNLLFEKRIAQLFWTRRLAR